MTTTELLALRIKQISKHPADVQKASETLKKARFASKEQFEKRFHKKLSNQDFKSGDLVLVRNSQIEKELNRKSKPRYLGPYEVIRRNRGGAYELKELDGSRLVTKIATFRLIPYITRKHWFLKTNIEESDDQDINNR
jgi:hypothetical protein